MGRLESYLQMAFFLAPLFVEWHFTSDEFETQQFFHPRFFSVKYGTNCRYKTYFLTMFTVI